MGESTMQIFMKVHVNNFKTRHMKQKLYSSNLRVYFEKAQQSPDIVQCAAAN